MRLTSFTDYGLRALMRIASDPARAFSTAALAEEFGLSRNHLAKIVQRLSRAGFLVTRRGGGGGAMLARPPQEIRLGEIVQCLEADQCLVDCFRRGGGSCTIRTCCRLKARLRAAENAFVSSLNAATLADIALTARAPGTRATAS